MTAPDPDAGVLIIPGMPKKLVVAFLIAFPFVALWAIQGLGVPNPVGLATARSMGAGLQSVRTFVLGVATFYFVLLLVVAAPLTGIAIGMGHAHELARMAPLFIVAIVATLFSSYVAWALTRPDVIEFVEDIGREQGDPPEEAGVHEG